MAKASESTFESLHNAVTRELVARVKAGEECSTADLKAAMEWLKVNNITGVASKGSPLQKLEQSLSEQDLSFIEALVQ